MRVLMTTQPGLGHFHPMVPLASALQKAGHTVAFACAASFAPHVEGAGFEAFPAGVDWLESRAEEAFPEMRSMSQVEQSDFLSELFLDTTAHEMGRDLLALCKRWQPDLLVRDYYEYGACVVGELLDIPHANVGIEFFIPSYVDKLGMEPALGYLRSVFGLPPYPALDMLDRYLHLSYIPPSYQFPEFPAPPVAHALRPVFFDRTERDALPEWIAALPERPTVYVTLGTVFNRAPEIFAAIFAGLRDEPVNVIATVGRTEDPARYGALPEHIHVVQYLPQSALLPHCDVVITHGGFNTTVAALAAGLPVVVIPLAAHHPLHAARCQALGAGRVLRYQDRTVEQFVGESVPALAPETVREAVREVLARESYREAARRLRDEMRALPGPERGVALLERLAAERMPLVAGAL